MVAALISQHRYCLLKLILKGVDGRWNTSATVHEQCAGELVDGHDGRTAEQSTPFDGIADLFTDDGYDAHGGCLLVDHANGCFVSNDSGNGGSRGVARDGNHIETDGADAGHSFQFLDGQRTGLDRIDHALILTDGDERA